MKKALFIDRDGTILREPEDEQIDSLSEFSFVPGAIGALAQLAKLDYELVLVSNQDGLGTPSFPEEDFLPPHRLMIETLRGEGVEFDAEYIDHTFPSDNAPTRKPGTAMLTAYTDGQYDLGASFVIGDRITDAVLAKNLGTKAIILGDPPEMQSKIVAAGLDDTCVLVTDSWHKIAERVRRADRTATLKRKTAETDISISVDLDNPADSHIDTGLKFFDHMLSQIPHHAGIGLSVSCHGDLEVDEHHTIEDVGICLGTALHQALGDKAGIERYGFVLPMDESRAMVLLDFGGRADFVWNVPFTREWVGDVPTEMFSHFFKSLCFAMQANLHIEASGENNHHLIEGVFKAFARALRQAVRRDAFSDILPTSKGVI